MRTPRCVQVQVSGKCRKLCNAVIGICWRCTCHRLCDCNVYDQAQCASQCCCIEDLWVSVQCLIKSHSWRYCLQPLLRTRVSFNWTNRRCRNLVLVFKRWYDAVMYLSIMSLEILQTLAECVHICKILQWTQNKCTFWGHGLSICLISKITQWIMVVFGVMHVELHKVFNAVALICCVKFESCLILVPITLVYCSRWNSNQILSYLVQIAHTKQEAYLALHKLLCLFFYHWSLEMKMYNTGVAFCGSMSVPRFVQKVKGGWT